MALPKPKTVREQIAWSYANLARADAALEEGARKYRQLHHIIRNKLYHGLVSGKMFMRPIYDDEKVKMTVPKACSYCGSRLNLAVDHLIPKIRGGADVQDNLILACRSCNSSKGGRDMLEWARSKGFFPSVLLLRRYLKNVTRFCEKRRYMDMELSQITEVDVPFDVHLLPTKFPPLTELKRWVSEQE